ncbi:MAG: PASTA domain-containing protein, partial [Acidimicrobiales bacterium]
VLALVALGVGTGVAVVALRVPSHPVPALAGLTLEQAEAEVADEKFELKVDLAVHSDTVPAGRIVDQVPAGGKLREGDTITVVASAGLPPRQVPDLTGLDQTAAEAALGAADLVPVINRGRNEEVPIDIVIEWAPTGTVTKNAEIRVNISDGPPLRQVPDLAGRGFEDAKALLAQRGLAAKRSDAFSDRVEPGIVISTQPAADAQAEKGSAVTVVVSKGPEVVKVPAILGHTVAEATDLLAAAGLVVAADPPPRGRRVLFSDPAPGAPVRRGAAVTLFAP